MIKQSILFVDHLKQCVILDGLLDDVKNEIASKSHNCHVRLFDDYFEEFVKNALFHQEVKVIEWEQVNNMHKFIIKVTGSVSELVLNAEEEASVIYNDLKIKWRVHLLFTDFWE